MRIVAVVGDFYHEERLYRETLEEIVKNKEGIDLSFTTREKLLEELKNHPDLVILGSENRLDPEEDEETLWLTEEGAEEIDKYVRNGGSWLAWHAGLASYEMLPSYISMLGGYFTHHPDEHAEVTYTYKTHPLIKEETPSFKIKDEHYFIKVVGPINIFLDSSSIDGESVAGWTKKVEKGKVAVYAPSHTKEGLDSRSLQKDLSALIDWCTDN